MKNSQLIIAIICILVVFLGIFAADQLGLWSTTSSGDSLLKSGDNNEATLASIEELRGSTTFGEIESNFNVPADLLAKAYNFEVENPSTLQAMDVSEAYAYLGEDVEMGTGSVRMFLYMFTGASLEALEEYENIPNTAVEVLKAEGLWTAELEAEVGGYVIAIDRGPITGDELYALTGEEHEEESEGALEVNGNTTIQNMLDAGLTIEQIEAELGLTVENNNMKFKDLCNEAGVEFTAAKNNLLALLAE